jgi:Uma2 family endonuclease
VSAGVYAEGRGVAMAWEEYEHGTGDQRGDYVDGVFWPMNAPRKSHQRALFRLKLALDAVLAPGFETVLEWAWKPDRSEWSPDVMVVPETDEDVRFTGTPLLIAEVLSSNRDDDLVRKSNRYARAGLPRFWLLDPRDRFLDALVQVDGEWRRAARAVDDEDVELDTGAGLVRISRAALLD